MSDPGAVKVASDALEHVANGADKVANALGIVASDTTHALGRAADSMGDWIATIGPEAWDILVRQQRITGIVEICMHLSGLVVMFGLLRCGKWLAEMEVIRWNGRDRERERMVRGYAYGDTPTFALWPMLGAFGLFLVLGYRSFWVIPTSIKMLANPKFYAALSLMEAVKK